MWLVEKCVLFMEALYNIELYYVFISFLIVLSVIYNLKIFL